jgi:hypothetical protein
MLTKPGEWGNVKIDPGPGSVNSAQKRCFAANPVVESRYARRYPALNLLIGLVLVVTAVASCFG